MPASCKNPKNERMEATFRRRVDPLNPRLSSSARYPSNCRLLTAAGSDTPATVVRYTNRSFRSLRYSRLLRSAKLRAARNSVLYSVRASASDLAVVIGVIIPFLLVLVQLRGVRLRGLTNIKWEFSY